MALRSRNPPESSRDMCNDAVVGRLYLFTLVEMGEEE